MSSAAACICLWLVRMVEDAEAYQVKERAVAVSSGQSLAAGAGGQQQPPTILVAARTSDSII